MKPPPFAYAAPATLEEAVGLLTEHAEAEPRVLAGGQSLIPLMNFRLAKPGYLVDLRNVAGLSGIRRDGDVLVIGAMTRMSEVERSPEVAVAAPLVAEAIGLVAHAPVRNSGTVGGSLAHADPAAELPAVALALDAELVAAGPGGTRVIPAAEFFTGPYSTALAPDEILTEIRLPVWPGGHAFTEFSRVHANFAVVAVAALVELDGDRIEARAPWPWPAWPRPRCGPRQPNGPWPAPRRRRRRRSARRPPRPPTGLSPAGDLHASPETRRRPGPDLPAARDRTGGRPRTEREVSSGGPGYPHHQPDRQRPAARGRGGAAPAARRLPPRGPRPARDPHRLRARRLRHLHRAAERRQHPLLHHPGRPGRRRRHQHGRGPGPAAASCIRSRTSSRRSRGCSAATAPPAC